MFSCKSLYNLEGYVTLYGVHCIYTRNTRSPLYNWRDQTGVKCFRGGKDERATVRLIVKYDGMLGNISFDFQAKIILAYEVVVYISRLYIPTKRVHFPKWLRPETSRNVLFRFAHRAAIAQTVIFHLYRIVIRCDCNSNPNLQLRRHWKTVDSTSSKTSVGQESFPTYRVSRRRKSVLLHASFSREVRKSRSKFIIWEFPRTC